MKYKSEIDHELIKVKGFDEIMVKEELKKAEKLQMSNKYAGMNKTPIEVSAVIEWPAYGFCFESNPELGKKAYHPEFPAYTSYVIAILRPVI